MKNSYVVQLGVGLWLASFGITGPWADFLSWPLSWLIGSFLDKGIYVIDLTINAVKTGMQMEKFKELAQKAHDKAVARVYTEEEKNEIRKQYLDSIRDFARFGSVPNNNP